MYEYHCRTCDQTFKALVEERDRTSGSPCACGGWGDYRISSPHIRADIDSDRWLKNRESHMKMEQKSLDNHGDYGNKRHV